MAGLFRRRPSAALVVSMLALFVALSGWGYAATSNFVLGKTNRTTKTTGLASSAKHAPAFAVTNTGGGTAGAFTVKPGVQPFTVSSSAKVAKLDADLLDGLDSSALQRRVGSTCASGSAIRVINPDGSVTCQTVGTTGGGTPANAFWSLNGNAGTSTTNFLGTTDAKPLVVKTNSKEALRVDANQNVGVGTAGPIARLEAFASAGGIGLLGTSDARGVVGRVGAGTSCPGVYAVGGCADAETGVFGRANGGVGVLGNSSARGVVGTVGAVSCPGVYGAGGCADSATGVFGQSNVGVGVIGNSNARGIAGTLGGTSCAGTYAVGGCGATIGDGVLGVTAVPANSITAAALHGVNTAGGDIFLGQSGNVRVARIDGTGKGFFNNGTQTGGADYAETMHAGTSGLEPGDVLVVGPHGVTTSGRASSTLVAGVYSTRPAVLAVGSHRLDDKLTGEVPVALLGVVPTKVSAENGAIKAGDLLVTARTPGFAMKAPRLLVGGVAVYPTGAILGKALEPLAGGKGLIRVLVMLR